MKPLKQLVAVVAGGSRGAGRGIALALGDAGATVYVAARTSRNGSKRPGGAPGTVEDTAEEVTARGGRGIPIPADLSDEEQVAALFRRVEKDHGHLNVLANSAWGANLMPEWSKPFWNLSAAIWRETIETMSVAWLTSVRAARIMTTQRRGLIIHVTDNLPDDPSGYRGQILHDLGHEFLNRLILGLSQGAKKSKIAVVGLNPGFMRTERVLMHMTTAARKKQFRFDLSETPEYIGRAVAALAGDGTVLRKTGQLLWVADLAKEYGFTDTDGRYIPRFDPKAPMQAFPC
ncbi:MAG TPA: SDR family NAD(P)-dependent oxidoreductase [Bryobacteraceae bacterium]|nr:SDR family NAD(P)-dependent oxidoreductase [Bryobacteraceae bacterium]